MLPRCLKMHANRLRKQFCRSLADYVLAKPVRPAHPAFRFERDSQLANGLIVPWYLLRCASRRTTGTRHVLEYVPTAMPLHFCWSQVSFVLSGTQDNQTILVEVGGAWLW